LKPDLVLGFSDLQADIAAELVKRGYPVMVFNHRSVADILQMIRVPPWRDGRLGPRVPKHWRIDIEMDLTTTGRRPRRVRAARACSSRSGTIR
jgi:hypothetical protein